ncbi:MAG: dTDP-4-dehydrorhamnose 3,5-epimerase [Bacteroidia bacterium]|nr:dTDP-4-dehydrorhamnose 3,5-epimerase [Bacteroidia bacterium]MBP9689452.1 dTDP-4-dehydrorhamnose 3,5-epimerase [Bacteroidia bacterium]
MEITTTPLDGLLVIKPKVIYDSRGYFFEPYNKQRYAEVGITLEFVQDNQSMSNLGAVRGLHFQSPPFEQGKLVRVVAGAVLDVVVDIRKNSPTYGQHFSVVLSAENFIQFWIPPGFAHGFATLNDNTIFEYKCSNLYNKQSEGGILWNDEDLAIDWQTSNPIISDKDMTLPKIKDFVSPF